VIQRAPLQIYSSSLIFAPHNSLVRNTYESVIPKWITIMPKVANDWDRVLHRIDTEQSTLVKFSPNGKLLASTSNRNVIELWDSVTGESCGILVDHLEPVRSVTFSPDSNTLYSGSLDCTVRSWDLATLRECMVLKGDDEYINTVALSPDGKVLVSVSYKGDYNVGGTIRL
jgi:WD40 repeat protein